MSQWKGGRFRVQNGQVRVYQVWYANGALGGSGTFTQGGALTWSGGSGFYWTDNGTQIRFWHTAGTNPVVGSVLTQGSRTFTISSFPTENLTATAPVANFPALFSTTGGTQGAIASNQRFQITGQPIGVVSATIGDDFFDLASAWAGATATDVEGVIWRDVTPNHGLIVIKQGSRQPFSGIEELTYQIDEAGLGGGGGGGGGTPPTSFSSLTMTNNWANVAGRAAAAYAYAASDDMVQLKGLINRTTGNATTGETIVAAGGLPTGRRPAERLDIYGHGENFAIRTDGSITYEGPSGAPPGQISFNGLTFRADGS